VVFVAKLWGGLYKLQDATMPRIIRIWCIKKECLRAVYFLISQSNFKLVTMLLSKLLSFIPGLTQNIESSH